MTGGYIKLYRKFIEWEWYSDANTRAVFLHLLLTANWKDATWNGIPIKRGQRLTSVSTLNEELHMNSEKKVRVALDHLEKTGEIKRLTTKRYTLITVENYEFYQGGDEDEEETPEIKGKQKGKQNDRKRANKRANKEQPSTPVFPTVPGDDENEKGKQKGKQNSQKRANKRATNEEYIKNNILNKNNKKDIVEFAGDGKEGETEEMGKANTEAVETIIAYLNEKAGTHYRPTTASTIKHINGRLKEGFTIEDFKTVIDKKCAEWLKDEKMSEYLRPATLFNSEKFEGYLNAPAKGGKNNNAKCSGNNAGAEPGKTRPLGTYI